MKSDKLMNSFLFGFFFAFVSLIIVSIVARAYSKQSDSESKRTQDKKQFSKESTDWLNSIIKNIFSQFGSKSGMRFIENSVNKNLDKSLLFQLNSVGNAPNVDGVYLSAGHRDSVAIAIQCENSVSFDLHMFKGKLVAKVDLKKLSAVPILKWVDEDTIHIQFDQGMDLDFDAILDFGMISFGILSVPIIGSGIISIVKLFLIRKGLTIKIVF